MACGSDYHSLDVCEKTVSADDIFNLYQTRLQHLVTTLETCPETLPEELPKIFPVDPYCQCQLGVQPRSTVTCIHCTQVRRLMDYRYLAPEREFTIVAGQHTGRCLVVEESNNVASSITVCDKVVAMDKFTLATVIHSYIYQKLLQVGFHTILPCYTSFICSTNGYRLLEASEPLSAVLVDDLSCQQALKQIATTIHYLTHVNFHRRSPRLEDWRIIRQPIAYTYKGVHVNCAFRVVLADFCDATLRIGEYWYTDNQVQRSFNNRPVSAIGPEVYRLTPATVDEFHHQRRLGKWNNGSYLWCSYLSCCWDLLNKNSCSVLPELNKLYPVSPTTVYYQDMPQDALTTTLEQMSIW